MTTFCYLCGSIFENQYVTYCSFCNRNSIRILKQEVIKPPIKIQVRISSVISKESIEQIVSPPPFLKKPTKKEQLKIERANKKKVKRKSRLSRKLLREWSQQVRVRDNYICQQCGNEGLFAHHIKPKKEYPELAFELCNGITLCNICHGKVHNRKFDINGAFLQDNNKTPNV